MMAAEEVADVSDRRAQRTGVTYSNMHAKLLDYIGQVFECKADNPHYSRRGIARGSLFLLFIWSVWFVWLIWSVWFNWFVSFVWLNQTKRINQMNKTNQMNQINPSCVSQPALFVTVRREIAEPRRETGARSPEAPMRTRAVR